MTTRASVPRFCSILYQDSRSWTDDLPVCKDSGIGLSTNSVYREDGHRQEEHEFEDQSFHFKYNDNISVYGIFDGHNGVQVAKYALDIITAEILLGQLDGKKTDEEVKQVLKQAFSVVETNYMEAIGDKLAEKTSLQMEIPDNLTAYEAFQKYPLLVDKLNTINTELSCGTTAAVALIYKGRLYVANVGDSRALLCKTDSEGVLRVIQLSQDHVLSNEDEILRLVNLGIPEENIRKGFRFSNQENTRCLGHYLVKGGYKEFEELSCAATEPVLAEPEVTGGILLDSSYRFLMLMSSGLYRSLEEATGMQSVNKELTQLVVEEFRTQTTLTSVAQSVVDKIVRSHHALYMSRIGSDDRGPISKREDITLLIRNFNFPLPHAISPVFHANPTLSLFPTLSSDEYSTYGSQPDGSITINSEDTSSQTSFSRHVPVFAGKAKPYVDFTEYNQLVAIAQQNQDLPEGIEFF